MQGEPQDKVGEKQEAKLENPEGSKLQTKKSTSKDKPLISNPCYFWSMAFFLSIGHWSCATQSEWLGPFVRTIPKEVNHDWSEDKEGL